MSGSAQMTKEQVATMFPGASKSTLAANSQIISTKAVAAIERLTRGRKMNRTEAEYERILKAQFPDSNVRYESYTLKLAEGCRYTPDFAVEHKDGRLEFHEVKGAFIFSKALTKPRTAAELFPQKFVLAQKIKGQWIVNDLAGKFSIDSE
jgi:hypothetical protein